jgi:hypothetical protein
MLRISTRFRPGRSQPPATRNPMVASHEGDEADLKPIAPHLARKSSHRPLSSRQDGEPCENARRAHRRYRRRERLRLNLFHEVETLILKELAPAISLLEAQQGVATSDWPHQTKWLRSKLAADHPVRVLIRSCRPSPLRRQEVEEHLDGTELGWRYRHGVTGGGELI